MRTRGLHLILLTLLCLASPVQGMVLDRILAVVNGEIISLGSVEGRLAFLGKSVPQQAGPLSEEDLQTGIQEMINHILLLAEAERFGVEQPAAEQVQSKLDIIKKRFSSSSAFEHALRQHAMTLENLRQTVGEHLIVTRFIAQRIGFFIIILPKEISQYYTEHQQEFQNQIQNQTQNQIQNQINEKTQKEIESILFQQKERKKLDEFILNLRASARIEISD